MKLFIIKKEREKKRGVLYAIDTGEKGGGGGGGGKRRPWLPLSFKKTPPPPYNFYGK